MIAKAAGKLSEPKAICPSCQLRSIVNDGGKCKLSVKIKIIEIHIDNMYAIPVD